MPKIATFKFDVGDEFKNAEQVVKGLLHFGLVEYQNKKKDPKKGGILLPDLPQIVVKRTFTIGWEEEDEDSKPNG